MKAPENMRKIWEGSTKIPERVNSELSIFFPSTLPPRTLICGCDAPCIVNFLTGAGHRMFS